MSSEHPTLTDNAPPLPPLGEGEDVELEPEVVMAAEVESWTNAPRTEKKQPPTLQDLMDAINALAEEVRGAISQIGETYGRRLEEVEDQLSKLRLERANGSTHYTG